MNTHIENIQNYLLSYKPWFSIILIIVSMLLYNRIHHIVKKKVKESPSMASKLGHVELAFNINKYILAIIVILTVLNINGINVVSFTAGLGISSIIIGFALQDILKDWIMGFSILWDNYFTVGDVIKYRDYTGKVVEFNLKATKIRELVHGDLVTISNRNISEISILSDWVDFDLYTSYSMTYAEIKPIIAEIISEVKKIEHVTGCEYLNVSEFASSSINYRMRAHCNPEYYFSVRRKCYSAVQKVYEKHGIQIPFNQLDVHLDKN